MTLVGVKDKPGVLSSLTRLLAKKNISVERLILNIMQRMSGISTLTSNLSKLISHTKCKILDTRKTTPGFRYPEKWAVLIGRGVNHRMGLFDAILIKDNHIASSNIKKLVLLALKNKKGKKITVLKTKPKKRYTRTRGHRQSYTRIKIDSL